MSTESETPSTSEFPDNSLSGNEELHSPEKSSPPHRSFLGKIIFTLVVIAVLLVGGIYFVYMHYLDPISLKVQFENQVSKLLELPVKVESIKLEFPTVSLEKICIGSQTSETLPYIELGTVAATPDVWELFSGKVVFENFYISSGSVRLVRDRSGTLIFKGTSDKTVATSTQASAVALDSGSIPMRNFDAENLNVTILDQALGRSFAINIPHTGLKKSLLGNNIAINLAGDLENFAKLTLNGTLDLDANQRINAQIDISGVNLNNVLSLLPSRFTIPKEISNPVLQAKLNCSLFGSLEVTEALLKADPGILLRGSCNFSSISPVSGAATITIDPISAKTALSMAKDFTPALKEVKITDGKIGGGASIVLVGGLVNSAVGSLKPQALKIEYAAVPTPLEILEGNLYYADGKLSWKGISAKSSGIALNSKKGSFSFSGKFSGTADTEATIDTSAVFKSFKSVIPRAYLFVDPSGKIAFTGQFAVDQGDFTVDGDLTGSGLNFIPQPGLQQIQIGDLAVHFTDFSKQSGRVKLEKCVALLFGNQVQLSGEIGGNKDRELKLDAHGDVDLEKLQAGLPIENDLFKKKSKMSGKAQLSAQIRGTIKNPDIKAFVELQNADYALPERGLDLAKIHGKASGDLQSITIDKMGAQIAGGKMLIDGCLTDFANPKIIATGTISGINLSAVRSFLACNFPTFPKELEFSGRSDLEVFISGDATQPRVNGNAVLSGANLFHPAMMRPATGMVGPIRFDNKGLKTEGLRLAWGSSTVRVLGKVDDLSRFKMAFDYEIQPLDLTDIGAFFLGSTGYKIQGMGNAVGKISGLIEKILIEGCAKLPQGSFEAPVSKSAASTFKFPFKDLNAPFKFHDKILTISAAKATVFGGTLETSGKVFFASSPIKFEFDAKGKDVQSQEFLSQNTTLKKALSGGVDLSFVASGTTIGLDSLDGKSSFSMKSGKYQAPPVAAEVFSLLKADNLANGDIKSLLGNFVFKNGRMNSDDMVFKSPLGSISYKGSVGLDTSLQGKSILSLSREACLQSDVLRQMIGNDKTMEIPFGVKGTLLSPSIDLKVEKLLQKAVEKRAKETLIGAITGNNTNTASTQASSASPTAQLSTKGLGKILGGDLGKILGGIESTPTRASIPTASSTAAIATQTVTATESKEKDPAKQVQKEIKKIGKNLKKLFKF